MGQMRNGRASESDDATSVGGGAGWGAALAAVAGAGVVIGSLVGTASTMLARSAVTPARRSKAKVRVESVALDGGNETSGEITLERTTESEAAGEYTMLWDLDRGRARLTDTVTATVSTVTRRFADAEGSPITAASHVRVVSAPQRDIDDLGMPYQTVTVPGELGEMPAWFIPSAAHQPGDWVIHVHGRGATLTEPLRTVPMASETGWHSLVIQYRNDPNAPSGSGTKYGLGSNEWRDVDAAIEWAVSRGARRIVLAGWSMGASIAAQAYFESRFSDHIVGLLFESPAVDWVDILTYQAGQMNMPGWVAKGGMRLLDSALSRTLVGLPERIDLARLDLVARAEEFDVPILLLHSVADTVVPVAGSQKLADARPDIVHYVEFTKARHTRLWNVDRHRWETEVREWFAERSVAAAEQTNARSNG